MAGTFVFVKCNIVAAVHVKLWEVCRQHAETDWLERALFGLYIIITVQKHTQVSSMSLQLNWRYCTVG